MRKKKFQTVILERYYIFLFCCFLHLSLRNKHFITVIRHKSLFLFAEKRKRSIARTLSKAVLCTLNSQNLFSFASYRGKSVVSFLMPNYSFSVRRYIESSTTMSLHAYHNSIIKKKDRASRSYNRLKQKLIVFLTGCTIPTVTYYVSKRVPLLVHQLGVYVALLDKGIRV